MTQGQLQQLKQMPVNDRIRKYRPLLEEKRITLKEYNYVIWLGRENQIKDPEPVTPEAFLQAFGGVGAGNGVDEQLHEFGLERAVRHTPERIASQIGERTRVSTEYNNSGEISGSGGLSYSGTTSHPSKRSGTSQKQRLLELLSDGGWHSSPEIIKEVYGDKLTGARYGARIQDLKEEGHEIESEKVEGALWKYRLKTHSDAGRLEDGRRVGVRSLHGETGEEKFEEVIKNINSG